MQRSQSFLLVRGRKFFLTRNLSKLSSKFYYSALLSKRVIPSYRENINNQKLKFYSPSQWKTIWINQTVGLTYDRKLAEFNFKLMHNILPCGPNLRRWKIEKCEKILFRICARKKKHSRPARIWAREKKTFPAARDQCARKKNRVLFYGRWLRDQCARTKFRVLFNGRALHDQCAAKVEAAVAAPSAMPGVAAAVDMPFQERVTDAARCRNRVPALAAAPNMRRLK